MWIAVTDADHASCCIRLVDVRTVDGVNTEQHHIAPLGRHGDGIVETVFVRRQVRGTGPIFGLGDMNEGSLLVRTGEKPHLPILMGCVVQVDQHIDETLIIVHVERMVLVHRKGMAGGRRLDVHRRVVQFDIGADELGHRVGE